MELSDRQQQILDIVKAQQPLSGEKIAEELGIPNYNRNRLLIL